MLKIFDGSLLHLKAGASVNVIRYGGSAILAVCLLFTACTSRSVDSVLPQAVGSTSSLAHLQPAALRSGETIADHMKALAAVNASIDSRISDSDKALLRALAMSAPEPFRSRSTSQRTFAVAIVDGETGQIIHQTTNHYLDTSFRIDAVKDPDASQQAGTPQPLSDRQTLVLPGPTPTPYVNSGPYHQLWTTYSPGSYGANASSVSIPCTATLKESSGVTPYVYFGGRSASPYSTNIESGQQWNPPTGYTVGTVTAADIQPYIRASTFYGGENSSGVAPATVYQTVANSGGSNPAEWSCTAGSSVTLAMSFAEMTTEDGAGNYGALFTNLSMKGQSNSVQFGVFVADNHGVGTASGDWNGWNTTCAGCRISATTSIAQNPQVKNSGDKFGPVVWQDEIVYATDGTLEPFGQCLDYPGWTTHPANECGTTPASPLNSVISVSSQSLPIPGSETVTINNASGSWTH